MRVKDATRRQLARSTKNAFRAFRAARRAGKPIGWSKAAELGRRFEEVHGRIAPRRTVEA